VHDLARRPPLERALQVAIVAVVLTAVLSAGAILSWLEPARALRWFSLAALCVLALAYALSRREWRRPALACAPAGALVALALLSAGWSTRPKLTLARGITLAALLFAGGAIAYGAAARPASLRRILDALVGATALVGLGGLAVLLVDHHRAIQPATTEDAARYQGLGGNPNTATMVLAVGMPLVAHAIVSARTRHGRLAAGAVAAVAIGSVVASGSRGAMVAGFGGIAVYSLLAATTPLRRLAGAAAALALLGAAIAIAELPKPAKTPPPATAAAAPVSARPTRGLDANLLWRLQEDIGRPPYGSTKISTHRTLFGTSGRAQAWDGALRLAAERPVVGYGLGMENRVFVDRYVAFGSNLVENSYLGLFLQLGAVGVAVFLALIAALGHAALRLARSPRDRAAGLGAAAAGGVAAGLVLGLSQSYIYSAGSNATAAVWICAFLLAAAATTERGAAA
jgi:O-antigen ligase